MEQVSKKIRYSLEPTYRKYGKKIIDTTKKQGNEFAKTAGKRIVKKSEEATGDLIGNKKLIKLFH